MTHEFPVRDEHKAILALIQTAHENIDLVPGSIGGQDVVFIVEWLDDDSGAPLMTYRVLAQIVTGEMLGVVHVEQPVLQA
jgi:hypothetical protein